MPAQASGNHPQVTNVVTLTEQGWHSQPRQPPCSGIVTSSLWGPWRGICLQELKSERVLEGRSGAIAFSGFFGIQRVFHKQRGVCLERGAPTHGVTIARHEAGTRDFECMCVCMRTCMHVICV